jgi:hypothetical protein
VTCESVNEIVAGPNVARCVRVVGEVPRYNVNLVSGDPPASGTVQLSATERFPATAEATGVPGTGGYS